MMPGGEMMRPCPDCLAESKFRENPAGVWILTVAHDLTCPWYLTYLGRLAARRSDEGSI